MLFGKGGHGGLVWIYRSTLPFHSLDPLKHDALVVQQQQVGLEHAARVLGVQHLGGVRHIGGEGGSFLMRMRVE